MTFDLNKGITILSGEIENTCIRHGHQGFVGSSVQLEADRLLLHWYGPVPDAVRSFIDASGLTVDVHAVPYPADVLHGAARSTFSRPGVNGAGVGPDYASLHISVRPGTSASDVAEAGRPVPVPGFAEPIPVTVTVGERGAARHGPLRRRG